MKKAFINWSSGKDAALALYYTQKNKTFEVTHLFTSINSVFNRVSMHGVRTELVELQAESIGIPLIKVTFPETPSMEDYETIMRSNLQYFIHKNCMNSIFGDIFLEDLREYREHQLDQLSFKTHFPLWKKDTLQLAKELISLGFKAIVVCVNDAYLGKEFVGRLFDESFLNDLPTEVDPCGENGEFHTFIFDGPLFKTPIAFETGTIVHRTYPKPKTVEEENLCSENIVNNGFYFFDLIPK